MNDRAERDIDIPVTPEMGEGGGTIARVLDIVTARIRASLWLIVIAGVIAVALVLFGVPVWHAVTGLLAIVCTHCARAAKTWFGHLAVRARSSIRGHAAVFGHGVDG